MPFADAVHDEIRFESGFPGGQTSYFPLCAICGEEVKTLHYKSGAKYTCQKCKLEQYLSDKVSKEADLCVEKDKKFKRAVERISKMDRGRGRYSTAIQVIHKKLCTPGWFDSTEEIMVAIELVRKRVRARHQVKFGRYRADFVLPEEKIVLEVDGEPFHNENTREKERIRDDLIVLALGPEWDVIRIPTALINQNLCRLVPAIRKVKEKRDFLRNQNGGLLPDWYDRKKAR